MDHIDQKFNILHPFMQTLRTREFFKLVRQKFTARKRSCGKVVFLQVSVYPQGRILSWHRGSLSWQGCLCLCVSGVGVGASLRSGGYLFPYRSTAAGSTYPTGMYSCFFLLLRIRFLFQQSSTLTYV